MTDTTNILSLDTNECVIVSSTIDIGGNQIVMRVGGRVYFSLANIENPSHYAGGKVWAFDLTDVSLSPSSSASITHAPQYSPTTTTVSI